ncbi:hypothetical protein MATL_G00174400 [Megalops atlanticus]|uniref:Uncharacterized protein n=1 Tax=Megalops atlanticus TaxID=7932 RepID=A0A9D3T7F5_MEGAT|nr:hypothetical protein MATL_G00174400 [Megalops atlanticus]
MVKTVPGLRTPCACDVGGRQLASRSTLEALPSKLCGTWLQGGGAEDGESPSFCFTPAVGGGMEGEGWKLLCFVPHWCPYFERED